MLARKLHLPVLLLVCLGLFAAVQAGKSAVKASALFTSQVGLSEQDEVKLLTQVAEQFFKQGLPQTRDNFVKQIEAQIKIAGFNVQPSELPILGDKLAVLVSKIKQESVPIEGSTNAQQPLTTAPVASAVPPPVVTAQSQGQPSATTTNQNLNGALPFDPTKALGYPVNSGSAGAIYDSITKNAKAFCTTSALPIRCAIIKTVQDVETFRNQPSPPSAEVMKQLHDFMEVDFKEAEKMIQDQRDKTFESDKAKQEAQIKDIQNRIEESKKVLAQIKDETLNMVVDQKKKVAEMQKEIDDQKYFLTELGKILNKPLPVLTNPTALPEVKAQAIPLTTSSAGPTVAAATAVQQPSSQLGRVASAVEDLADPVLLTSTPTYQLQPTAASTTKTTTTSTVSPTQQQPVLLNTVAQPAGIVSTTTVTTVKANTNDNTIAKAAPSSTASTTKTQQTSTTSTANTQQTTQSQESDNPNIFVRFWRWLTGLFSSKKAPQGQGISGHVVLNNRLEKEAFNIGTNSSVSFV